MICIQLNCLYSNEGDGEGLEVAALQSPFVSGARLAILHRETRLQFEKKGACRYGYRQVLLQYSL